MSGPYDQRTVSELVGDAVEQFTYLIRNEMAIARAELTEKASEAAVGVGFLLGGALVVIPAMVMVLMALAALLFEHGLSDALANLVAGVVGFLISGALAYVGKRRLSLDHLKPKHTMNEIERDISAIKDTSR
jgi:uncharacterized membrane protein YqjE